MRVIMYVILGGWLLGAGCVWAGCEEGVPDSCRQDVLRLDEAYRTGLGAARGEAEKTEVERLRVVALRELVERTYESTLAWMEEREDLVYTLASDQGLWLDGFTKMVAEADTREEWKRVGDMLLSRLRVFGTVTSDSFCIGEGCDGL